MRLHYKGKFDGNTESIPKGDFIDGSVKFEEPDDPQKLGVIANGISIGIMVVTVALLFLRGDFSSFSIWALIVIVLEVFPHELLHALCFKEDVYLYTNPKAGMVFVTGPESMTKARFIFMSLLPNIIFGFIPFILFLINPAWGFLGTVGAFSIPMGAGDYFNVYNALTQMPKGSMTYLYGFNSYWYMPQH